MFYICRYYVFTWYGKTSGVAVALQRNQNLPGIQPSFFIFPIHHNPLGVILPEKWTRLSGWTTHVGDKLFEGITEWANDLHMGW